MKNNNNNYHIVVVISEFNKPVTDQLLDGATRAFHDENGGKLTVISVPGAFEVPATTRKVAQTMKPDAIVTLGAIIKGETKHFDLISAECTRAIQDLTMKFDIPILFGILTTENADQARERAGKKDKGYEVMKSAFHMIRIFKDIK